MVGRAGRIILVFHPLPILRHFPLMGAGRTPKPMTDVLRAGDRGRPLHFHREKRNLPEGMRPGGPDPAGIKVPFGRTAAAHRRILFARALRRTLPNPVLLDEATAAPRTSESEEADPPPEAAVATDPAGVPGSFSIFLPPFVCHIAAFPIVLVMLARVAGSIDDGPPGCSRQGKGPYRELVAPGVGRSHPMPGLIPVSLTDVRPGPPFPPSATPIKRVSRGFTMMARRVHGQLTIRKRRADIVKSPFLHSE